MYSCCTQHILLILLDATLFIQDLFALSAAQVREIQTVLLWHCISGVAGAAFENNYHGIIETLQLDNNITVKERRTMISIEIWSSVGYV